MNEHVFVRGIVAGSIACLIAGCALHIDKPVTVAAGDSAGSIYEVDGNVTLQSRSRAHKISTVDGDITVDRWAQARALRTVDGDISMASGSLSTGSVYSVDGTIHLARGVRVAGDVGTATGTIHLDDALVEGALQAVSGRIEIHGHSEVAGGIELSLPSGKDCGQSDARGSCISGEKTPPVVVIGPDAIVDGPIVAKRGGTLWVSRKAHIRAVTGIAVKWFDGDKPPSAPASDVHHA